MTKIKELEKKALALAALGGSAFWITNLIISLTPIAAEYRAGLSISYFSMLLEAVIGGMSIGFGVSYILLRFFDKIPTRDPILKSAILSLIVLIIVTITLEVPAKFFTNTDNAFHYFLVGALFNLIRLSALGIAIGIQFKWQYANTINRLG
jgi:hypothetical protein